MAFRSEEEKTRDILMYETKAEAGEIREKYIKTNKLANTVTLITAVVVVIAGFPLFYSAYGNESIVLMLTVVIASLLLIIGARFVTGAILSHSLSVFLKWGSLSAKWEAARKDMHTLEEKFAEDRAFENDITEAETKLMSVSKSLIEFAKKNNIEY